MGQACFLAYSDLRSWPLDGRHDWASTSGPIVRVILEGKLVLSIALLDSTRSSLSKGIFTYKIRLVSSSHLEISRLAFQMNDSFVRSCLWRILGHLVLGHVGTSFHLGSDTGFFGMRLELSLRRLLRMMEWELALSWAICRAIRLGCEVWNLSCVLSLFLRLIVRCNEVYGSHFDNWSFRVDLNRTTSTKLPRGRILVIHVFIYHELLGRWRYYLRLIQVHVRLIRNLTGERRLRVWLYAHSHRIVLMIDGAFRAFVVTLHLLFSFFLSHIVLLVALVVAHEGTLMKSDSLSTKWSIQILSRLPRLLCLIRSNKWLSLLLASRPAISITTSPVISRP